MTLSALIAQYGLAAVFARSKPGEVVEADETRVGGRTRVKWRGVHDMVLVAGAVEVRQRKLGMAASVR
jgi:hypothetical protein